MTQAKAIDKRRRAYQAAFNNPEGKQVLQDLAKFCGATKSSFSRDPIEMGFREGRREVWLRIQQHLKITEDDIWRLFEQEKEDE
jgi:heterodisulfide reductase subunit B